MSWPMTDDEIIKMFRGAKDKQDQIEILGDLNLVSKKEVYDKLQELGCDLTGIKAPKVKTGGRVKEPIDELRAMELYNEGLDDLAIAEALGVSEYKIGKWRRMMRLPKQTQAAEDMPKEAENEQEDISEEKESPDPAYMSGGALLKILQRVCDGYNPEDVSIRSEGLNVRDVIVSVTYNAAGKVDSVQLNLMTD